MIGGLGRIHTLLIQTCASVESREVLHGARSMLTMLATESNILVYVPSRHKPYIGQSLGVLTRASIGISLVLCLRKINASMSYLLAKSIWLPVSQKGHDRSLTVTRRHVALLEIAHVQRGVPRLDMYVIYKM